MPEKEPQFESAPENKIKREEEFELRPGDRALVLEIINNPVVQKGSAKYKIFSKYYFGDKLKDLTKEELRKYKVERPPSKEEIRQRADEVFGEDNIYQRILKLERPAEDADFIIPFAQKIGKTRLDQLKKAGRGEDNFNEAIIKSFAEETKRIIEEEQHEIGLRKVGEIVVGIDREHPEVLRPHIPRFAENMPEANKGILKSFKVLAKELRTNPDFKNIKRLEGMSWLIGEGLIRGNKWHNYSEDEMKKLKEKAPEAYKSTQITGLKMSPRLFRRYLLTGEMPRIGVQWITREEFVKKYEAIRIED